MIVPRSAALRGIASVTAVLAATRKASSADRLQDLIAAARNEKELTLIAGSDTFGGQPGLNALNDTFNKRFNLDAHVILTPGPAMTAVAARLATEYKGNRTASTGIYLGPVSMFISLDRDGALEHVDWAGTFPWVTREMVISPDGSGLLVRTGPNAITYNPKFLAPENAPKRYEDLVDPRLGAAWRGRLAIPPYPDWLAALAAFWGADRVRDFAKRLVAVSAGQLRYGEAQPLIDGQFSIIANEGSALELKWHWEEKGVILNVVFGSSPVFCDYFQMGVPKNSAAPNLAKLFVGFLTTREAQAITDKYGAQASHLVPGTRVYAFVRANRVKLEDPHRIYDFYSSPQTTALYDELGKIVRQ
jgi:ABC-type Fe3+ transport system substrate-binding protein